MECRSARKQVEWSVATGMRSLPEDVEAHLERCRSCRREQQILARMSQYLRREDPWQPPEGFFDRLAHQAVIEKQRAVAHVKPSTAVGRLVGVLSWLWTPHVWSWSWVTAIVLAGAVCVAAWWGIWDVTTRTGEVDYTTGTVHIARSSTPWRLTESGQTIRRNSTFRTARDGEAILTLSDKSEIYLASFSELSVLRGRTVELRSGMAWFEIVRGREQFGVQVPQYGTVLVLGTSFGIVVGREGRECLVSVAAGRVLVDISTGREALSAGEEIVVTPGGKPVKRPARNLARMLAFRDNLIRQRNDYELRRFYPSLAPPLHPATTR